MVSATVEDPWCDFGDMPQSMCEHCKHGIAKEADVRIPDDGRVVPAVFKGMCRCGNAIERGQDITRNKGRWVHEECAQ